MNSVLISIILHNYSIVLSIAFLLEHDMNTLFYGTKDDTHVYRIIAMQRRVFTAVPYCMYVNYDTPTMHPTEDENQKRSNKRFDELRVQRNFSA